MILLYIFIFLVLIYFSWEYIYLCILDIRIKHLEKIKREHILNKEQKMYLQKTIDLQYYSYPLISALCITRNRVKYLKRSIIDFLNQTYPNKQLVIVYDDDDISTCNFLDTINNENIKKIKMYTKYKLGILRNISIENADGDYFIQWDDDDEYHPMRMEIQYKALSEHNFQKACCLSSWIIYDMNTKKYYLSDNGFWQGSVICPMYLAKKYKYSDKSKGEDEDFIRQLIDNDKIFTICAPELYLYRLHDRNTYDRKHGKTLILRGKVLEDYIFDKNNSLINK